MTFNPEVFSLEIRLTNFYKIRDILNKLSDRGYYRGAIKVMFERLLGEMTVYARDITHKRTGMLASSHMWEYDSHAMKGRLFVNPRVVYAEGATLRWPYMYGVYEHARGGDHAFYQRTYSHFAIHGRTIAMKELIGQLPK